MVIYKITNTKNGKVYIGQTVQPFNKRVSEHKKKMVDCIMKLDT